MRSACPSYGEDLAGAARLLLKSLIYGLDGAAAFALHCLLSQRLHTSRTSRARLWFRGSLLPSDEELLRYRLALALAADELLRAGEATVPCLLAAASLPREGATPRLLRKASTAPSAAGSWPSCSRGSLRSPGTARRARSFTTCSITSSLATKGSDGVLRAEPSSFTLLLAPPVR